MSILRLFILVRRPLEDEPFVELNPIVSRHASQAAWARFAMLVHIIIKIVSHMIDSYYIVCKLYAPQVIENDSLRDVAGARSAAGF
jgi:hypothetical protein